MKVSELIEQLNTFNPNAEVEIELNGVYSNYISRIGESCDADNIFIRGVKQC
jgi:hypothetical protein